MRRLVALLWLGLPMAEAGSDQCQLVSQDQALRAVARLVYELGEPCGDRLPRPMLIKALAAISRNLPNFWQLIVNGKSIGLACTFIHSGIDSPPVNPVFPLGTSTR
jgi:hypothetical protein